MYCADPPVSKSEQCECCTGGEGGPGMRQYIQATDEPYVKNVLRATEGACGSDVAVHFTLCGCCECLF